MLGMLSGTRSADGRKRYNSRRLDVDFMADTGASTNMVGEDLVEHLRPNFRKIDKPLYVNTANGKAMIAHEVDLRLPAFVELQSFLVGPKGCPPLLAIGNYCLKLGYSFVWRSDLFTILGYA